MADKAFDIVVVGELNADLILSGDVTPAFRRLSLLVARPGSVCGWPLLAS
jgi:hypothetical protein